MSGPTDPDTEQAHLDAMRRLLEPENAAAFRRLTGRDPTPEERERYRREIDQMVEFMAATRGRSR